MITVSSGQTASILLPSFGRYTLRFQESPTNNEKMMDVACINGNVSIYGVVGDNIPMLIESLSGASSGIAVTYNGAGSLTVLQYDMLRLTTITLA